MLIAIEDMVNIPVMSLQTGTELARTVTPIVDPRQLTIAAFYVAGPGIEESPSVLYPGDIRELSDIGFIIDDATKLMPLDGLVRLKEIIDFDFEIIGLKVVDEHKRKLGKISGFSLETSDYTIVQVYTEQSLIRSLSTAGNVIHRSQIISVNNSVMVVQAPTVKEGAVEMIAESGRAFVNPFRGGGAQPDNLSR